MGDLSQPLRPMLVIRSEVERATNTALQVLLKAIALRDKEALTDLYDCAGAAIYVTAMDHLKSKSDSEEIVCDVFMFVWDHADRYDGERGSVLGWLTSIARYRAISLSRQRRRTIPFEDVATDLITPLIGPEESLVQLQNAVAARKALGRLEPLHRTILRLSFFYGMSHREIGEFLDLPLGTVKSHLRRSLLKMRVMIPR